jgi:hypothetical protein
MKKLNGWRPDVGTVIACLALFLALGGAAYAGTKLKAKSVGTKQLKGNAVSTAKIADSAVSTAKLANNAVTSEKLASASVKQGKILGGQGTTSNAAAINVAVNVCQPVSFNAPGIKVGDVVAFTTAGTVALGNPQVVWAVPGVPADNSLQLQVCADNGSAVTINPGALSIAYQSFR